MPQTVISARSKSVDRSGARRARQAAQPELGGFDIDDVKQRAIGQERRQKGVLDDFGIS